jgi:hypothetical protein
MSQVEQPKKRGRPSKKSVPTEPTIEPPKSEPIPVPVPDDEVLSLDEAVDRIKNIKELIANVKGKIKENIPKSLLDDLKKYRGELKVLSDKYL